MRRSRLLVAVAVAGTAWLSLAGPGDGRDGATAEAQSSAERAVTITSGPLAPGSTATVTWTGFNPGPAYVYICKVGGSAAVPAPRDCYGDTLVVGVTAADGSGSAEIQVRSALFPYTVYTDAGQLSGQPGGTASNDCRTSPCGVAVTECSNVLNPALSAQARYELAPGRPDVTRYDDDPVVKIEWITPLPEFPEEVEAQITPRTPVEPEPDPPPPPVVAATGPKIAMAGSDLGYAAFDTWGRRIAELFNLKLDYTRGTYVDGIDDVIDGVADVALSAAPATPAQQQELAAAGRALVYVPISVSTLGIGFNAYPLLPMEDLKLSPRSVARLLDPPTGEGSDLESGFIAEDQGACAAPPDSHRVATAYLNLGVNEATLLTSKWLSEAEPGYWTKGVTDKMPAAQANAQIFTSNSEIAPALATARTSSAATSFTSLSQYARLGLVDSSWAGTYDVPMARLQNEARQWVAPTPAGALATLASSPIGADNIVDVDVRSTDPAAYPLVNVNYAVAPVVLSDDFTAADAMAVRAMLTFLVSAEGQEMAAAKGFVPLTAELQARALASVDQVGSLVPLPPQAATTTTTTVTPATTVESSTTVPATTVVAGSTGGPQPVIPAGAAPRAPSSGGAATRPTTPSATTRTTVRPTGAQVPVPAADPTASVPGAETVSSTVVPVAETSTATEEESPPDVFGSLLDGVPKAPALPTLGAAGALTAVTGQGINLWRRRPTAGRIKRPIL